MIKRERLRQVFKERFDDFDGDNRCVTKFIISKNIKGLWYVQLKCSIDITHTTYRPSGLFNSTSTILYDIEDRCKWVGDFFNCEVNITADDRNVYISFYPLLTDLECVALTE
jgi:hypothetical protein